MFQHISPKLTSWLSAKQIIIEIALAVLVVLAGILKFLHLPGADEVLMISMLTLSAFYFLAGFFFSAETTAIQIPQHIFTIASSVCVTGLLFTVLHLPGAREQLMIGVISLGASALVIIFLAATGKSNKILPVLLRLIILGGLSLNALIGLSNIAAR